MTLKNNTFREIWEELKKGEAILLFPHISVDGDALGSSLALCKALRNEGKEAYVLLEDEIDDYLKFLKNEYVIFLGSDDKLINSLRDKYLVTVLVDCSDMGRIPKREELFKEADIRITLDHHKTADYLSDFNYIDSKAAATGEVIFDLISQNNATFDEDIAIGLYVAISMDTGNFQYSNTTSKTHGIMSKLYECRESFSDINVKLHENVPFKVLKLTGRLLESIELFAEGKVAVVTVTQKLLKKTGCMMGDSEGIINTLRAIEGVEVAIVIKEKSDNVKASLRSKSYFDVAEICQKHGGGGHTKAAGFTSNDSVEAVKDLLVKEIGKSL